MIRFYDNFFHFFQIFLTNCSSKDGSSENKEPENVFLVLAHKKGFAVSIRNFALAHRKGFAVSVRKKTFFRSSVFCPIRVGGVSLFIDMNLIASMNE